VVILGIAASIIAAQLGTQGDVRAAAASRVLMADLTYAQNRAIATQSYHYVIYDSATDSYSLYYLSAGVLHQVQQSTTLVPYTTAFNTGALAETTISSFNINGSQGVVFDELGAPHMYEPTVTAPTSLNVGAALSSPGTIGLQCENTAITVSIEPDTGELTVQ
jgi:hypothetical protein